MFCRNQDVYSVFKQKCNLERHTKKNKTIFVSTPVLFVIVKMLFSAFFILGVFGISKLWRYVFWYVIKHQNNTQFQRINKHIKQQENKMQGKHLFLCFKTKQNYKQKQQRNILKQKANQTKQKWRAKNISKITNIEATLPKHQNCRGNSDFIRNRKKQTQTNTNKQKQTKKNTNKTKLKNNQTITPPRPLQQTQKEKQKQTKLTPQENNNNKNTPTQTNKTNNNKQQQQQQTKDQ